MFVENVSMCKVM